MVALQSPSSYSPKNFNWPAANPFHAGEVRVQQRLGVQDHVMSYAPRFVRPYLPEQHRDFFQAQPFVVVAARDAADRMWSTLLFMVNHNNNSNRGITSPNPTRLSIPFHPLPGDALEHAFLPGSDVGILGLEFATRRRNRVNGRLLLPHQNKNQNNNNKTDTLELQVDQSFGNCPQYIQPRDWWTLTSTDTPSKQQQPPASAKHSKELTDDQIQHIQSADTLFVATGYRDKENQDNNDDPRFGNDASHRGGSPGFVQVQGRTQLLLPDYSGNNHFNTIGNLVMDPRMGITIPLFETGGMIQLTGRAEIQWDEAKAAAQFPGAHRVIVVTIDEVIELPPGSFPIQFSTKTTKQVQVVERVQESPEITSFYLAAVPGDAPNLPTFQPGQHLSLELNLLGKNGHHETVTRTYSLSNSNHQSDYYRISVKRDPLGLVSSHLHDHVQPGDILDVQLPSGDFQYHHHDNNKTVVFVSAGVGVTPVLSMLHSFVHNNNNTNTNTTKAIWIHAARNGRHHAFRDEVQGLQRQLAPADRLLQTHIIYTRPNEPEDEGHYQSSDHLTIDSFKKIVGPNEDLSHADFYICGGASFASDMEKILLEQGGVAPTHIHQESF